MYRCHGKMGTPSNGDPGSPFSWEDGDPGPDSLTCGESLARETSMEIHYLWSNIHDEKIGYLVAEKQSFQ